MSDQQVPRFNAGDHVYVQLWDHTPELYYEEMRGARCPKKLMVRGVLFTCDFTDGYSDRSRPVPGSESIRYLTSYSNQNTIAEDNIFQSVEEFEERRHDEIAELSAKRKRESAAKRAKEYRAAKRLVADFEATMFEAHAAKQGEAQ